MDVFHPSRKAGKWRILTLGARWDRSVVPVYEASARGRRIPLLKTLLTNYCQNRCTYCSFRAGRKCPRLSWEPRKLAEVTKHLWEEGRIQGLFLSSSIQHDPDYVMERQLEVLRLLREMGFTGYIHLRVMPGVSRHQIQEAARLADRLGVNLEAPEEAMFMEICPDKGRFRDDILKRLAWIVDEARRARVEAREAGVNVGHARAGVDTQLIVGATDDNDLQHLKATERLYRRLGLRRVYYSGFEPIPHTPLEGRRPCPISREHRLYQASFLLRDYGFSVEELREIMDDEGFLPNVDPKLAFAKVHPDLFPIDLNTATYHEILRIPHVGPVTARKILKAREVTRIRSLADLERVLGPTLAWRIRRYISLSDRRLL